MAELGLGSSLGLQGTPRDYTALAANQIAREGQAQQAKLKAQQAENEAYDKFKDKIAIDTNKYENVYLPQAGRNYAMLLDTIEKKRQKSPLTWKNDIDRDLADYSLKQQKLQNGTQSLRDQLKGLNNLNPDEVAFNQDLIEAVNSGDENAFRAAKQKHGISDDSYVQLYRHNPKPTPWTDYVNKLDPPEDTIANRSNAGAFSSTKYNEDKGRKIAVDFVQNGGPHRDDLFRKIKEDFSKSANFNILSDAEQTEAIGTEAIKRVSDNLRNRASYKVSNDTSRAKEGAGYSRSGNILDNGTWRVKVDGDVAEIESIKDPTKPTPERVFYDRNGKGTSGVPLALIKRTDKSGEVDYILKVGVPLIGVDEKTHKPYSTGKHRVEYVSGKSAQNLLNEMDLSEDEIFNGAKRTNPGVSEIRTKESTARTGLNNKKVKLSTIKSKVGSAGFEGYDEKELVDYYKSQGYSVE